MKRGALIPLKENLEPSIFTTRQEFDTHASCMGISWDRRTSLPNGSLSSDFLRTPEGEVIGVAVGVRDSDWPSVTHMFRHLNPAVVKLWSSGNLPSYFRAYPKWNWIEVTWKKVKELELIEAQSNEVLWMLADETTMRIDAMVLADLDYIENETEAHIFAGSRS